MAVAVSETGQDLTTQRIPDLRRNGYGTGSVAIHALEFRGTLGYWTRFESEVRQVFNLQQWTANTLSFSPAHPDSNHVYFEQLNCGDEHSVVARFGQQVGQIMTSVAQDLNIDIRFGDFKTTPLPPQQANLVPDFAAVDFSGFARFCHGSGSR